jgi:flagellar protein FliS
MNAAQTQSVLRAYGSAGLSGVVHEANPHRLISMLYDGARTRIASARAALATQDFAMKGRRISECISIIANLRGALDFEGGGNIATALDSLYDYMIRCLLEASAAKDARRLDEVDALLAEIRAAWEQVPALPKVARG